MKLSLALPLSLIACVAPDVAPPAKVTTHRARAQIVLHVDPSTGTVTQIGSSARGVHVPALVVQDRNPVSNPPETFQVVTSAARLPGQGTCPATDNCFDVRVDSFLSRGAQQVTLVIDAVSPTRTMSNPDQAPPGSGLASALGITTFGDIGAGSASALEELRFTVPNLDPYTVNMTLYEQDPAPPVNATPWEPNDTVLAMGEGNGVLYLAGNFDYLGPRTGPGVALDLVTGALDPTLPSFGVGGVGGGGVYAIVSDGAGGLIFGGGFSVPRRGLLHLSSTGVIDTNFPEIASGVVSAVVLNAGVVYVGGIFGSIGGQPRNLLAAVTLGTGAVTAWNPNPTGPSSSVSALSVDAGLVYVGGNFSAIGGQSRAGLAALSAATGLATGWNPASNGDHRAISIANGVVYVAGGFTTIGGQSRSGVAGIDAVTGLATAFDPAPNSVVFTLLAVAGGPVYAAGNFTNLGGAVHVGVAALSPATGLATSWSPPLTGARTGLSLAVSGATLYLGSAVSGSGASTVVGISTASGLLNGFNVASDQPALALAVDGGRLAVGSEAASFGGVFRRGLAAIDRATGAALPWDPNPSAGASFQALAVSGATVYVGGNFTSIGGAVRRNLAALDATTALATAFNAGAAPASVFAIAPSGVVVYVGGTFPALGGQPRSNLAALDAATGNATAWNPGADGAVLVITPTVSRVYVGGDFLNIAGQPRSNLAALDPASGLVLSSDLLLNGAVRAIAVDGARVYVGGDFNSLLGENRRVAALDADLAVLDSWDPSAASANNGIAVDGGRVFTTDGSFHAIDPTSAARLWGQQPSGGALGTCLLAVDGVVYAAGEFSALEALPGPSPLVESHNLAMLDASTGTRQ